MPTWHMISLQDSASPSMEQLTMFNDFTMAILTLVMTMVGLNMAFILCYKLTDRVLLQQQTVEIIWTTGPVVLLVLIALPSLKTLYTLDDPLSPNITIKAIGHQWYWSYEYSDFSNLEFDSYMTPTSDLSSYQSRLLDSDNSVVLPTNSQIRLVATSADVIHGWALPALGLKTDAVPGRLNQLMFYIKRSGIFFGQCSEICGSNHSFMPIKVEAIPMKMFLSWVTAMK
uniref:Cytochrome c oxidase subunit 2 n=1 Tax=Pallaseopsis kessleri TaxID=686709 RepID=A0A1L5BW54_9CRUS|nr:cytochrome c oxidase subunit II [Pallaseopsis kessleri]APL97197.1 cytochrome c oxidase subunit II [Pallaseopsis kessleri]